MASIKFGSICNGSGCPCGTQKICVAVCSLGYALVGATVQVSSGGTVLATCTTDSTGCCTVDVPNGTYTITVTWDGTVIYSGARTLSGTTVTIYVLSSSAFVCCGSLLLSQTLYLTDAAGTLTLGYDSSLSGTYGYPIWTGGHSTTQTSCSVATPNNICAVAAPSSGPVRVCYQLSCQSTASPKFSVQRSWSWVYRPGPGAPIWYQDPTGFTPGQSCITAPPPICGNPLTDTAGGSGNATSTSPLALSITMSDAISNATSDPIGSGDTVAISS